jgi:hypothetical protein
MVVNGKMCDNAPRPLKLSSTCTCPACVCPFLLLSESSGGRSVSAGNWPTSSSLLHILCITPPCPELLVDEHAVCSYYLDCAHCGLPDLCTSSPQLHSVTRIDNGAVPRFGTSGRRSYRRRRGQLAGRVHFLFSKSTTTRTLETQESLRLSRQTTPNRALSRRSVSIATSILPVLVPG